MTMTTAPAATPDGDPEPLAPAEPPPPAEPPEPVEPASLELDRYVPDGDLTVIPGWEEMRGMAAMAVTLAGAHAVPDALKNKPNDVFLLLLTARELGVAPTAALRTCYVVNGTVTLAPKLRAAKVRQEGIGRIWPCTVERATGECEACGSTTGNTDATATWHATRADEQHARTYSFTFTTAEAQRAKDKGKSLTEKDNWKNYPQRMLSWRALGYLLDDVFPEVGTGLYSADEMGAVTDEDGMTVIDVATTDPLEGMSSPRGHNREPAPGDEQISDEALGELRGRIDRLAVLPEAAAALRDLLMQEDEEGNRKLPPLAKLRQRQVKIADAMIASIERRATKGEWGEWDPPDEQPPAAEREWSSDVELAQQVADEVKALSDEEVVAAMEAEGLPEWMADAGKERAVLAEALFVKRGGTLAGLKPPAPAESAPDAPGAAAGVEGDQPPPEPTGDAESAPGEPLDAAIEYVRGITRKQVALDLGALGLPTGGNEATQRARLAQHLGDHPEKLPK